MSDRSVVQRTTRETRISVGIQHGAGESDVVTGVRFLDHMMTTFARYSRLDVTLRAAGDLRHHIIEDVGIAVGRAVADLTTESAARYGDRTIPMDDALVHACVDMGGRPFYCGPLPSALYDHWMRSFADNARATVHLRVLRGTDRHHIIEAAFKSLAMAVGDALRQGATGAVLSTKGSVQLETR